MGEFRQLSLIYQSLQYPLPPRRFRFVFNFLPTWNGVTATVLLRDGILCRIPHEASGERMAETAQNMQTFEVSRTSAKLNSSR